MKVSEETLNKRSWLNAPETQQMLQALCGEERGAAAPVRFVGGCVRNALLGAPVDDLDLATQLEPEEVALRLEAAGLKAIPTGLEHGTITAVVDHKPFEITTLRRDVETHGRHATVAFTTDWAEDAMRRDFTMNALYAYPDGTIVDSVGGIEDLKAHRVRFIGDAQTRIKEDYLRILRFFRIHAWYGQGELDEAGLKACEELSEHLSELSIERVQTEILKLLQARDPLPTVRMMAATGVLARVLPEAHGFDLFDRLVRIEREQLFVKDGLLRLAALVEGEPKHLETVVNRLRLSNADQARLNRIAQDETRIFSYMSAREMRRALYTMGRETFLDRVKLEWARDERPTNGVQWRALLAMGEVWQKPELPLTGAEVMKAGVPEGPDIGRIIKEVEDWWIDADFTDDRLSIIERLKAIVQATIY